MTSLTTLLAVLATLCSSRAEYSGTYVEHRTRNLTLKQGTLQGSVVGFRVNRRLPKVAQYRGIPYAAPPVGELRFMPSGSAPDFPNRFKLATDFGPVCPQTFPDTQAMTSERREAFFRLREYLQNQSEDCLYLNVYTPYGGNLWNSMYPVMVFIHGESFEWNSGNPYDGSVLAAYGNVIVVTLNYRLGVLGFLKTGTDDYSKTNFGLVDQIAALLWVKDNIRAFGGNADAVTLFGHGTGAVCASLLMLSPMVLQENNKKLFQRAILMGGSALSDWALASNPDHVAYQMANSLNCQMHDDFPRCLRRKRLDELMRAHTDVPFYNTRYGPVVDNVVVPNNPKKLMTTYNDIFKSFELLYGVAEMESVHLLEADALLGGMLEKKRDQELDTYLRSRCERRPEHCFTRTLAEYSGFGVALEGYASHEPDRASLARDSLLDILSDARTVAPVVQMARYHAAVHQQSYFYVFTHTTISRNYVRDKTYTGEELPYVFGVPMGGSTFHFTDAYNERERLFSEIIMTYFCNFANNGNPNMPRKTEYYTLNLPDWTQFDADWPEFDLSQQQYLQLGMPPLRRSRYREEKMQFWNEVFPQIAFNSTYEPVPRRPMQTTPVLPKKSPPPWILSNFPRKSTTFDKFENFHKDYGKVKTGGDSVPDNMMNTVVYGTVVKSPPVTDWPQPEMEKGISTTITIALLSIFIISNLCLFLVLYLRRYRKKKLRNDSKAEEPHLEVNEGCNLMKLVSKSSRSDDTYEAVKSSDGAKIKLPRQMSSSTIDAHTKVRDWITNEIVQKYSPRFLRRHRQTKVAEARIEDDTLTPTRPVTPSDDRKSRQRPPLVKSSSIPIQKNKKVEKVSVAVDATPSGRGNSVLAQQPIELTKSLDRPNFETPLRRSLTLDDLIVETVPDRRELRKSITSINLRFPPAPKKLKTFDPQLDVNVTSRDEDVAKAALTPEESLQTIKRRNFPKVLPDYPSREALANKRRSMPAANFSPIPENGRSACKTAPPPPVRTTSALTRTGGQPQPVCQSAPMLAEEPPSAPEPELTCNNLYFGPLVPKMSSSESSKLNTQPIYDRLKVVRENVGGTGAAKTIITTDPKHPIKKAEPRVIIKPTMVRSISDPKKNIPRVMMSEEDNKMVPKQSLIPTLAKAESSSSESAPSEESDTGTVVKKIVN